jgi:ABC-type multidrug transport system fused ATPase/permease subunit
MDEGTWSTVLGTLRESTIPRWSLCCNRFRKFLYSVFLSQEVLFAAIPTIYLTFQLQKYYFSSAKELMRLNGTTKSPIANHFGESISGTMTIRAFKVEDQF